MYLWKIERTDYVDYEENIAHVIAADTEMEARQIAAGAEQAGSGQVGYWYLPTTTIEAFGKALANVTEPGIILTSNRGA